MLKLNRKGIMALFLSATFVLSSVSFAFATNNVDVKSNELKASAQQEINLANLDKEWELKTIKNVPKGIVPIEFDSVEDAEAFLQSIKQTSDNTNKFNKMASFARAAASTKTYTRRVGNTWIAGKFYYEMDITVKTSGKTKTITDCTDGMTMSGWTLGFDYTESSRKFKIASDKKSVSGRAKGTIDYYLLVNGLVKLYSEPYDWTIDFNVSEAK